MEVDGLNKNTKVVATCDAQPCKKFKLANETVLDSVKVRFLTTVTNNIKHFSSPVTMNMVCGSTYTLVQGLKFKSTI